MDGGLVYFFFKGNVIQWLGSLTWKKSVRPSSKKNKTQLKIFWIFKIFFKRTAHSLSFLFWKGHLPQIVSYLIIQRFENYGEGIASADWKGSNIFMTACDYSFAPADWRTRVVRETIIVFVGDKKKNTNNTSVKKSRRRCQIWRRTYVVVVQWFDLLCDHCSFPSNRGSTSLLLFAARDTCFVE